MIPATKYFVLLNFCYGALLYVAIEAIPDPVNCNLPTGSPQFALLCQIEGALNASSGVSGDFIGLNASQVCDGDCRCVMGATGRGGRCGQRPRDGATYCICDYGTTPTDPIYLGQCDPFFPALGYIACSDESPLQSLFANYACNADCQCSHGYNNTGNHKCSIANGQTCNTQSYCVCENATNL